MNVLNFDIRACALTAAASLVWAIAASPAVGAATPHSLADCVGKPSVRPSTVVLACGDGNASATGLHWTGWGEAVAVGSGTETYNDCTPNCAQGHDHTRPIMLIVNGVKKCSTGVVAYDTIVVVGGGETFALPRPVCGSPKATTNSDEHSIVLRT